MLIHSGQCLGAVAGGVCTSQCAAGGRGRAVYHGGECGVYGLVADRLFLDFVCEAGIWGHWCMDCHGIGLDLQNRLFPGTFSLRGVEESAAGGVLMLGRWYSGSEKDCTSF